jgi:hypothetical protein
VKHASFLPQKMAIAGVMREIEYMMKVLYQESIGAGSSSEGVVQNYLKKKYQRMKSLVKSVGKNYVRNRTSVSIQDAHSRLQNLDSVRSIRAISIEKKSKKRGSSIATLTGGVLLFVKMEKSHVILV